MRSDWSACTQGCACVSRFDTITFVGDSLMRGVYFGLLFQTLGSSALVDCVGPTTIPLDSTPLHRCGMKDKTAQWATECREGTPLPQHCCSSETLEGNKCLSDMYGSWYNCREFLNESTEGDTRMCDGKLKARLVVVTYWHKQQSKQQWGNGVFDRIRASSGRNLVVIQGGLHYATKRNPARPLADKLYIPLLTKMGVPRFGGKTSGA